MTLRSGDSGGGSVEHAGKVRARSAGLTFCGRATARPATVASPSHSTEPPVVVSDATAFAVSGTRDTDPKPVGWPSPYSQMNVDETPWRDSNPQLPG
jgi:hypothetical protein